MSHNPLKGGTLDRDNQLVGPSGTKAALDSIASGGAVRGSVCYATDEDKYYFVNQSDVLQELGGSESAGKNYCTDFDFNGGNIDFWNTADASNFTISLDATSKLIGANSLKLVKAASDQSGDYISTDTFAVDTAMKSQVLDVMFWADLSDANIADDDLVVTVWNVDNDVAVAEGWKQLKAGKGFARFDFQLDPELNYQIRIKQSSTNATAYTAYFDYFVFSPAAPKVNGPIITEWKDFTPSFANLTVGNGILEGWQWRQVSSNMEIRGKFVFGSTSSISGAVSFTIPNGASPISNSLYEGTKIYFYDLSTSANRDFGRIQVFNGEIFLSTAGANISATTPFTWATGDEIHVADVSIPIAGWQSNMEISSTYTNRKIVVLATKSGTQTITAGAAAATITGWSIVNDTTGSFNATTGVFTAPETDYYVFPATYQATTGGTAPSYISAYINTPTNALGEYYESDAAIGKSYTVSLTGQPIKLNKGDTVSLKSSSGGQNITVGTSTIFSAYRLGDENITFGRQPKYFAHYTSTAGASVSSSGTNLVRATKVQDTNAGWYNTTTGAFTPERSGVVTIGAGFGLVSTSVTAGSNQEMYLVNSVGTAIKKLGQLGNPISASIAQQCYVSGVGYYVNAGETYYIKGYAAVTANELVSSGGLYNWITFSMD